VVWDPSSHRARTGRVTRTCSWLQDYCPDGWPHTATPRCGNNPILNEAPQVPCPRELQSFTPGGAYLAGRRRPHQRRDLLHKSPKLTRWPAWAARFAHSWAALKGQGPRCGFVAGAWPDTTRSMDWGLWVWGAESTPWVAWADGGFGFNLLFPAAVNSTAGAGPRDGRAGMPSRRPGVTRPWADDHMIASTQMHLGPLEGRTKPGWRGPREHPRRFKKFWATRVPGRDGRDPTLTEEEAELC